MVIQVLGTGCPKCNELEKLVRDVAATAGIATQIEKVSDFQQIAAMGVFSTPALAVNGVVKCAGRSPSREELLSWLK